MGWFNKSTTKKSTIDVKSSLELINAAQKTDIEKVKSILKMPGIDLNLIDEYGRSAILCARRLEIIKLLIEAGANLNIQNPFDGTTPLIISSEGDFDITKLLIISGVNLNIKNQFGTALFRAIAFNDLNICKLLIESGIDVNIQNKDGETALIYAVSQKNNSYAGNPASNKRKIIELLIKSETDWNIKNKYNNDFVFYIKNEKELSKLYPDKYAEYIKNK